jgi:hypothetical protein
VYVGTLALGRFGGKVYTVVYVGLVPREASAGLFVSMFGQNFRSLWKVYTVVYVGLVPREASAGLFVSMVSRCQSYVP